MAAGFQQISPSARHFVSRRGICKARVRCPRRIFAAGSHVAGSLERRRAQPTRPQFPRATAVACMRSLIVLFGDTRLHMAGSSLSPAEKKQRKREQTQN